MERVATGTCIRVVQHEVNMRRAFWVLLLLHSRQFFSHALNLLFHCLSMAHTKITARKISCRKQNQSLLPHDQSMASSSPRAIGLVESLKSKSTSVSHSIKAVEPSHASELSNTPLPVSPKSISARPCWKFARDCQMLHNCSSSWFLNRWRKALE